MFDSTKPKHFALGFLFFEINGGSNMQYNITYREKDKGWQYIISYKDTAGKWKQKSKQGFEKSRKGKQDAKEAAEKDLETLKNTMELNAPEEFHGITFGEFGKRYIEHTKLYREYKTVQSTQTVLNKFSGLDCLELLKITSLDIQSIVDKMTKEGLNTNTIKYYVKKLTIIFNAAKNQYKIINYIPTKEVKINKPTAIKKRALTQNEIADLYNKLNGTKYSFLVFLAVNTGMRIGELLGLTWNNIDLKNNEIKVTIQWKKLKDGTFNFGELKSKNSNRIIPISKDISKELSTFGNIRYIDNRVFQFTNKDNLIAVINRRLKKVGYDMTFHELRHTYASKLIANKMDFKTTACILGHDVKQTINTYSHINDDMLLKAKQLIENIF